ncbi:MAG: Serine/threonine-protein kinase PknD [Chlamydiae bacterium]|nr:Serine/threonine-protein kinase PknD [Chlamydiota bacterium]
MEESPTEIVCPSCNSHFFLSAGTRPKFCTHCGKSLEKTTETDSFLETDVSFVPEHIPDEDDVQFTIGTYQILKRIGKGGMGEVFLAYDTQCGRRIALKRIRTDLETRKKLKKRFLKEARITAQLTHPSIIPIYSIHEEGSTIYYTMPYVEGETLRQIINKGRKEEKLGRKLEHQSAGIPFLTRILVNVCQAIAYAHSHGVLHRDIKGENIIIGKFGEVLILDWGLTKIMSRPEEEETDIQLPSHPDITQVGKVVGTISYMAPERAKGNPATEQTDIYSLGVLLYVILTLRAPFKRGSLDEFRETMDQEEIRDPSDMAPYRDVPPLLAQISKKCLDPDPKQRYLTVEEMIHDLENYIEGRSEWFEVDKLDIKHKDDWQFQENVLMAGHMAITRSPESSQWVSLMISKGSFGENIRIDSRVRIGVNCHGIGILLSIPEAAERKHLNDGYCLWVGTETHKATKLMRSTVEVLHAPEVFLQPHQWYNLRIEKIDHNIYFYIDNSLQFSYISHIPLTGTHVGLIYRDTDFELDTYSISTGSQNVMVNCLAVPDAFLAHKDYEKALVEYRRIGYTFPGRAEGRDAMFRAGVTLIEQSRQQHAPQTTQEYLDLALQEFEKLRGTPGAPLEYLGKALVYQALQETDEEIKCYMLAYRKYKKHPLLNVLEEQIVYRMHECSRYDRHATYQLVFLVMRQVPEIIKIPHTQQLFKHLQKHWEKLPFIQDDPTGDHSTKIRHIIFSIKLSFWLATPYFLEELLDDLLKLDNLYPILIFNILYCVLELGDVALLEELCGKVIESRPKEEHAFLKKNLTPFAFAIKQNQSPNENLLPDFLGSLKGDINFNEMRIFLYLTERALIMHQPELVSGSFDRFNTQSLNTKQRLRLDYYRVWALLIERKWQEAGQIFEKYPIELVSDESSPLHFLYGCWLYVIEGPEIAKAHFSGVLEVSYPRSWTLATHYINGKLQAEHRWLQQAFLWEKRQLYKQLSLYYHCIGDEEKKLLFQEFANKQVVPNEET